MANFGPIDTSVLYGQANHRSEDVLGDPDTTLTCGHIEIDTHLITALVERWRPETHTFHFSVGEATVTLQDISIIWALPIEGNLITGVDIKWTTQQWQNYCHQWLGFRPNENAFKRSRIKLSALLDWLLNNTCDDESPFDAVLQEARVCVMCIIGGILCPDATGNTVSLLYLRHMEIIDEERPSNWVITNMGMVTHNNTCPIPSNNAADLMPTVIDVEKSYPFLHMLHGGDVTGRIGQFHRDYIVKWNDVQSMLVVRPEIVNGRGTVPDYMNWYHQITRVQISHNIGSTDITGYRPTDTRDWEYVISECAGGPAGDEAGPSNVYTPSGPSNVYNEAGPSNVYNEAGPSNFFTPTGPSYAYTSNMPFSSETLHITSIQRHEDILGSHQCHLMARM
ncbi:UNVERIFIED_CONTAM: Serine/threonine-protein phosphatase 7 long form [Sesamum calycinum]|uniref:Serine/threonine-protein phosphatase 7 long form n=1 Tax=Sesamum calycinum TaxID=2727403 RepID=A0AAW2LSZ4_9LAMI